VVSDVQLDIPVGELVVKEGQLYVQCTTSSLLIKKLHPAGRREMTGQEFIRGYLK
jgi:methionyl-tRNA formyltransferase